MIVCCANCLTLNRVSGDSDAAQANCGTCKQALFKPQVWNASETAFNALIKSECPVVVDFWASWCGPCQSFAPVFKQVCQQNYQRMLFIKVDTEKNQQLSLRLHIRSIPTLALFSQGKEIKRISGALPKSQFERWIQV